MQLTLPYPISANVYWRTAVVKGRAVIYVSKEAKKYRETVALAHAQKYGAAKPLAGPVIVTVRLWGQRPKDWTKRKRVEGDLWWVDAKSIDLGNAEKVLGDALQGLAYVDDKQIVEMHKYREEPDAEGARVVVTVLPL